MGSEQVDRTPASPAILTLFLLQLALADADSVGLKIRLDRVSTQPLHEFLRPPCLHPAPAIAALRYEMS